MRKQVDFLTLPHDTQIDIIQYLYSYNECHIEYSNRHMSVTVSWCIRRNYPMDFWVSQTFTKESLGLYIPVCWGTEWRNITRGWDLMTDEEKNTLIAAERAILRARAEQDLIHIKRMAEFNKEEN